jgi:hypothetical protein
MLECPRVAKVAETGNGSSSRVGDGSCREHLSYVVVDSDSRCLHNANRDVPAAAMPSSARRCGVIRWSFDAEARIKPAEN